LVEVVETLDGALKKFSRWLDAECLATAKKTAQESRKLWIRSLASKFECYACHAVVAKNQQKVKARIQEAVGLFTKFTKLNFKDYCNAALWALLCDKIGAEHMVPEPNGGAGKPPPATGQAAPVQQKKPTSEPGAAKGSKD
jgi:hypothetical protein